MKRFAPTRWFDKKNASPYPRTDACFRLKIFARNANSGTRGGLYFLRKTFSTGRA